MESKSSSWLDVPVVRLALMIVATILLNFGLFFILNFIAPFVTGLIVGYIVSKIRDGFIVGFVGTALSYLLVFLLSEWLVGFGTALIDVAIAVLIMSVIGACGGVIGSFVATRVRS